jgi:hypothetical protein
LRSVSFLAALAIPLTAVAATPTRQPPASPAPAAAPPAKRCAPPRTTFAEAGPEAARARTLGDQPPANHYLAVSRQLDGCPEPALVRTGIGG